MIDPSLELLRRLERIERRMGHVRSDAGHKVAEIGPVEPLLTEADQDILTEDDKRIFT